MKDLQYQPSACQNSYQNNKIFNAAKSNHCGLVYALSLVAHIDYKGVTIPSHEVISSIKSVLTIGQ